MVSDVLVSGFNFGSLKGEEMDDDKKIVDMTNKELITAYAQACVAVRDIFNGNERERERFRQITNEILRRMG